MILSYYPQKAPILPTCWPWTCIFQNCETGHPSWLNHSACGTPLPQCWQMNAAAETQHNDRKLLKGKVVGTDIY